MLHVEVLTLGEEEVCAWCCETFGPDRLALRWHNQIFCTHPCLEQYAETVDGRDFGAAQDQALAEAQEVIGNRPDRFILLYDAPGQIRSVVLAPPQFVFACVHALASMTNIEGDVEPPN